MKMLTICTIAIGFSMGFASQLKSQQVRNPIDEELLDLPIKLFRVDARNIHLTLMTISDTYKVPIGLEVSSKDDLLNKRKALTIHIADGTLRKFLDEVVKQNTLYTWEVRDGVINVFPKTPYRDKLLVEILRTRIHRFSVGNSTSRFNFRESLTKVSEVKNLLLTSGLQFENEVFSSRGIATLGRDFSLEVSDWSLADILNQVVKKSEAKYWVVRRNSNGKEYLLLNL